MLDTRAATAYAIHAPTAADVHILATEARDLDAAITAHPRLLAALHAAIARFGPIITRTTLAAVLDVTVRPDPDGIVWELDDTDPGDSVVGGVVVLVPDGG
jgi:hypothetical protein